MSCTSLTFCLVADDYGKAYAYDGSTRDTVASGLFGQTDPYLIPDPLVACVSRHFCAVSEGTQAVLATS